MSLCSLKCTSHTCVYSGEYTLHGVGGGMSPITRLPRLVALSTQIKVVADETFIALTREAAFTTGIAADTYGTMIAGGMG